MFSFVYVLNTPVLGTMYNFRVGHLLGASACPKEDSLPATFRRGARARSAPRVCVAAWSTPNASCVQRQSMAAAADGDVPMSAPRVVLPV